MARPKAKGAGAYGANGTAERLRLRLARQRVSAAQPCERARSERVGNGVNGCRNGAQNNGPRRRRRRGGGSASSALPGAGRATVGRPRQPVSHAPNPYARQPGGTMGQGGPGGTDGPAERRDRRVARLVGRKRSRKRKTINNPDRAFAVIVILAPGGVAPLLHDDGGTPEQIDLRWQHDSTGRRQGGSQARRVPQQVRRHQAIPLRPARRRLAEDASSTSTRRRLRPASSARPRTKLRRRASGASTITQHTPERVRKGSVTYARRGPRGRGRVEE